MSFTPIKLDNGSFTPVDVPQVQPEQSLADKIWQTGVDTANKQSTLQNVATGFGQGILSTLKGAGTLGQGILDQTAGRVVNATQGKGFTPTGPDNTTSDIYRKGTGLNQAASSAVTPKTTGQSVGFGAEKVAEFLAPSGAIASTQKGLTSLVGGEGIASWLGKTALKVGTDVAATGGISTVQQGEYNDNVKTAMLVSGVLSTAGSVVSGLKSYFKPVGEKIQTSLIRPTQADMKDGFNISNVNKYDVGGNLNESAVKVHVKLNDLSQKLNEVTQNSGKVVDLDAAINDTEKLLKSNSKLNFGSNRAIQHQLEGLKEELGIALPSGPVVDPYEATLIKRGAGTKGAWAWGRQDPEADATEKVYNAFYHVLKEKINAAVPEAADLNQQISDLIPISNAILRRLPVAQRNNIISLTDNIGLFAAVFDPKALALLGAEKLAKSGRFAKFLIDVADKVPTSAIGQRFLGQ